MPGWKDRLGGLFGIGRDAIDPDLCLNPPDGVSPQQRVDYCSRLIETGDPAKRARFHNARGLAYKGLGRIDAACEEIAHAIALEPKPLFFTNRAFILWKAGAIDDALSDLARAVEIDPDYAQAYEDRADILFDIGRSQEGLRDIDRALALKATAYRHYSRGTLLMQLARYDDAIATLDAGLVLRPDDARMLERRATSHLMLDQPDRAVPDLEKALELKPNMASAHLALATALDVRDPKRALHHFNAALELDPDDGPTLNNRAYALDKLGDYAGAEADFDRAVALMPDEPIFRNNRALWRIESGDFAGAEADLAHGLGVAPGDSCMLCALAHLAVIADDHARAEQVLAQILAQWPDHADARNVLGWTRLAQGRIGEAEATFEHALEQPRGKRDGMQKDRVRWMSLYGLGISRQRAGDAADAEADLAAARALRPDADQVVARWGIETKGAAPTRH